MQINFLIYLKKRIHFRPKSRREKQKQKTKKLSIVKKKKEANFFVLLPL
jgi:hypothetical protein